MNVEHRTSNIQRRIKKGTMLLLIMAGLSAVAFLAKAGEIGIGPVYTLYNSNEMESSLGLKGTYSARRMAQSAQHIYLWASAEELLRRYGGQECIDLRLFGIGLGIEKEMWREFQFHIDGGYFDPHAKTRPAFHADGAWYAFRILGPYGDDFQWKHYGYDIDGGFGGSIGLSFNRDLTDQWAIGGGAGYRYLKLCESVYGWNEDVYDGSKPHWEIYQDTSFSGIQIGMKVSYRY